MSTIKPTRRFPGRRFSPSHGSSCKYQEAIIEYAKRRPNSRLFMLSGEDFPLSLLGKMVDTSGHHIVYGTLRDYLTGEELPDTDDERYRQQLARFLVEEKGFDAGDLQPRLAIETVFNGQFVRTVIELTVCLAGRKVMIVRYGPGSLVTRERPAIAAARVLDPGYRIPLAVVTNVRDAELLETKGGKVLGTGMAGIPNKEELLAKLDRLEFEPFDDERKREREARILNVFDVEVCCRDNTCALPPESGTKEN